MVKRKKTNQNPCSLKSNTRYVRKQTLISKKCVRSGKLDFKSRAPGKLDFKSRVPKFVGGVRTPEGKKITG